MLTDDDLDNLRDLAKRQGANHAEKKILAAVAEIERLRSDRDSWAQQADDRVKDCAEFIAEIERLRELVYAVPPTENMPGIAERMAAQTWKEACEANRDEVARLDNMLRTYRVPDEVVDIKVVIELRAEIERLRSQLAAMERGYKSYRDTAEEEFARLRSLLRESIRVPQQLNAGALSPVAWRKDYERRVREALGDA